MTRTLDRILPTYHHHERHTRHVAASPADVWNALLHVPWAELALARPLLALRALPARLSGSRPPWQQPGPIVDNLPIPVLAEKPGRELVFAGALRPWPGGDRPPPALDRDTFPRFTEPGWVKVAMEIRLDPEHEGIRLSTETRIHATDARARRAFALYWLLIRPGSGLVRRELLRVIARRAEHRNPAEAPCGRRDGQRPDPNRACRNRRRRTLRRHRRRGLDGKGRTGIAAAAEGPATQDRALGGAR